MTHTHAHARAHTRNPPPLLQTQEIQRLQLVIANARFLMENMLMAIRGEVVVSEVLADGISSVFDARVPSSLTHSAGGDEISWLAPTMALWYSGLLERDRQNRDWLSAGRPASFWMTGFFNAQGFLTAVRQEVTRLHFADKWSLDAVMSHTEVTAFDRPEQVRTGPKEGVLVHGLFLDGAGWSQNENSLVESEPKKLFCPLPLIVVTAMTKQLKRGLSGDYGPFGAYECPVYKYPKRTDRYWIFFVSLASRTTRPVHWTLRGAALLCATE